MKPLDNVILQGDFAENCSYVTGFEKRDLIAQIMILRYRRF